MTQPQPNHNLSTVRDFRSSDQTRWNQVRKANMSLMEASEGQLWLARVIQHTKVCEWREGRCGEGIRVVRSAECRVQSAVPLTPNPYFQECLTPASTIADDMGELHPARELLTAALISMTQLSTSNMTLLKVPPQPLPVPAPFFF